MSGLLKGFILVTCLAVALDLEILEKDGLFCVNSTFGMKEHLVCPVLDLAGDKNVLLCQYSGPKSRDFYDPRQSETISYEEKSTGCNVTEYAPGHQPSFCEYNVLLNDGSRLKMIRIIDAIDIGSYYGMKLDFLCYQKYKDNHLQTDLNLSVLALGPGENSFIKEVNATEPENNVLQLDLQRKIVSFTIKDASGVNSFHYTKNFNQYNLKIIEITNNKDPGLKPMSLVVYLNSLSKFSSFSPNIYFKLIRSIKASLNSESEQTGEMSEVCYSKHTTNITDFPSLWLSFTKTLYVSWEPEEYTYMKHDSICVGIFPSTQNYLGLNFLSTREVFIFLDSSQISFSDLIDSSSFVESSSESPSESSSESSSENTEKSSQSEKNSENDENLAETSSNESSSNNFFIFLVCVLVILAQIAAGYFFLTRNRNQRLQDPGIDLPSVSTGRS